MRLLILFLLFGAIDVCSTDISAQTVVQYSYDSAGNRVSRILLTPKAFSRSQESNNSNNNTWENKLSRETIQVYPNPVLTDLTVSFSELPEPGNGTLRIYDMQGKLLLEEPVRTTETIVSMKDFIPAVYIMRLTFGEMQSIWKIIKQ